MEKIKIALLGFGHVGQGVWTIMNTNKNEITKHSGYEVEIGKILVRDIDKPREVDVPKELLTTDADEIFNDDSIKIVVELMGGREPAKKYMLRAMKSKKHVVTANKLVIATEGEDLFKASAEEGVLFYFEASVGGGIPVIREINESLTANKIEEIIGIVNGTTNYILTKMTQEGKEFSEALKEAQDMGYAEADPTSDVEGFDAAYKLAIMASLSFNTKVDSSSFYREGISKITKFDIENAAKLGYVIKLLAIGKEVNGKLELRVHPTMISKNHPIANVNDSFNAIFIKGNAVGDLMLYGRGAGALPTGSAIIGDIISILRNNVDSSAAVRIKNALPTKKLQPSSENISSYYIRLDVKDHAGVLGELATIFGKNNVGITSVEHYARKNDSVPLVFVTHRTLDGNIVKSMDHIKTLSNVNSVENIIRIEDLK
jgi:homoserine dehydrogenase